MIKILKSNKIIIYLLIILCIFLIINPKICTNSCLNAINVWGFKVFPVLFPFFILTRLIVEYSTPGSNYFDKKFSSFYKVKHGALPIFSLSVLSGYPMGAKIVSKKFGKDEISQTEAKNLFTLCSVSGPMFMVGTVGVSILNSFKAGLFILIANILGVLINAKIFSKKSSAIAIKKYEQKKEKSSSLSEIVYDSLTSILMVAGFMVFCFLIIDFLKQIQFLYWTSKFISLISNNKIDAEVIQAILCGIFEMTRGILDVNACSLSLQLKTIISSAFISFGGICIILQSLAFIKQLSFSFKEIIKQKISQCFITTIISIILIFIFFN